MEGLRSWMWEQSHTTAQHTMQRWVPDSGQSIGWFHLLPPWPGQFIFSVLWLLAHRPC